MDASSVLYLFTLVVLLSSVHLSSQMLDKDDWNSTSAGPALGTSVQVTVAVRNATVHKNCTTATGESGSCMLRRFCNYGTASIDFTMYAPRGFARPCKIDETCCPFKYQLRELVSYNHTQTDKDFEFDNED